MRDVIPASIAPCRRARKQAPSGLRGGLAAAHLDAGPFLIEQGAAAGSSAFLPKRPATIAQNARATPLISAGAPTSRHMSANRSVSLSTIDRLPRPNLPGRIVLGKVCAVTKLRPSAPFRNSISSAGSAPALDACGHRLDGHHHGREDQSLIDQLVDLRHPGFGPAGRRLAVYCAMIGSTRAVAA